MGFLELLEIFTIVLAAAKALINFIKFLNDLDTTGIQNIL